MKILVVEDDTDKRDQITSYLKDLNLSPERILIAKDMAEFMGVFGAEIGLCIIDLRLPAYEGAVQDNNGIGVLQAINRAGADRTKIVAISAYPDEFENIRPQFESRGCLLLDFKRPDIWQGVLKQMVLELQNVEAMDFLIFCALQAERAPYTGMPELDGMPKFRDNLTRYDIAISGKSGSVIELPRMGLIDAAITAGLCIEKFKPRVVAMSGICAGFPGRAELGQLLVAELAYEYQSGKWSRDGFSEEPYQVPTSENMRVLAREFLEDDKLLSRLETGWSSNRPSKMTPPKLVTFTSGSAVIASESHIAQIADYHRRVAGLDMEVYGILRAAHLAACKPEVICAKTVVDLAGGDKDDHLQPYGSSISAKFIIEVLEAYFSRNSAA